MLALLAVQRPMLKRVTALIAALVALLVSTLALAYTPPPIEGHITDTAGKLTAPDRAALNDKLARYRKATGNEIAVFIVATLEGETIEDVAYHTFNTWKVGKAGNDNGVLLVIAPAERKTRIETGKGVGDRLTDLQTKYIQRDRIGPKLREGDFRGAVDDGTTAIIEALGGDVPKARSPVPQQGRAPVKARKASPVQVCIGIAVLLLVIYLLVKRGGGGGGGGWFFFFPGGGGGGSGGGGGWGGGDDGYSGGGGESGGGGSSDDY